MELKSFTTVRSGSLLVAALMLAAGGRAAEPAVPTVPVPRVAASVTNVPVVMSVTNATTGQVTLSTNGAGTNRTLRIPVGPSGAQRFIIPPRQLPGTPVGVATPPGGPTPPGLPPSPPFGLPPRIERMVPAPGATNAGDYYERLYLQSTAPWRSMLANTNLDAGTRAQYEKMVARQRESVFFQKTNEQLWADIHDATRARDPVAKERAEKELAALLTGRLAKSSGKTYPTNLSLQEVIAEMQKAATTNRAATVTTTNVTGATTVTNQTEKVKE